jgi:hypothetical protein
MRTDELAANLAREVAPVRPLRRPWRRAVVWALCAAGYLAILVALMSPREDLALRVQEPRFVAEQLIALLTGLTAAVAAFTTIIPGYGRRVIVLPLVFLGLWISTVAAGAAQELQTFQVGLLADWGCVATILAGGAVPGVVIAAMIRRGAPLTPGVTAALAALAAAGLGNLGICLFHSDSSNLVVLFWHCGTVVAISGLAGLAGRYFLRWPRRTSTHAVAR